MVHPDGAMPTVEGRDRRNRLRRWWRTNGRVFSWRRSNDPWTVFLAEFLLQRTRADQVAAALPTLIKQLPSPAHVAGLSQAAIVRQIGGLGLTRRAAQLRDACRAIGVGYDGEIPTDPAELQTLPGVGPYVATAISVALTRRQGVLVDTNTVRVALRVTGTEVVAADVRRQKRVVEAISQLLGGPAGRSAWWAVLDLAALICRPTNPACPECPISDLCKVGRERVPGNPS